MRKLKKRSSNFRNDLEATNRVRETCGRRLNRVVWYASPRIERLSAK